MHAGGSSCTDDDKPNGERKMYDRNFVVYAPACGYSVSKDTGKGFQFEAEADHFVLWLRAAGHVAWVESNLNRPRDEYNM
jgi:hypothetical protein